MSWRRYLLRKWWDKERALEIESYLEIEIAENVARGMTRGEAASAARRKLGNPASVREEIYRMNTIGWLEGVWQDLRYGARLLRLNPGFACVAIGSLALGIGANAAIFQLLDAVRLRTLPVWKPQELVEVRIAGGNRGMGVNPGRYGQLTRPIWQELSAQQEPFTGVFAWGVSELYVGPESDAQPANGMRVSGAFFRVLGVPPWRGRLFTPEDEVGACPAARAVVSYGYWLKQFGGVEIGPRTKLTINGAVMEVIGVTPPGFFGLAVGEAFDIALPFCKPGTMRRDVFDIAVIGRLRPGWTLDKASAYFQSISRGIFEATMVTGYSSKTAERYKNFRLAAYPVSGGVSSLRETYDSSLWMLLAITGLVLLIACANLANLMLARSSVRRREIAVRLALGASRGRLVRQLLVESALLAAAGAAAGVGIARIVSRTLVWALSTESGPVSLAIATDERVFFFATLVAALTCVVFGVAPALLAANTEPVAAIKAGGRSMTAGRERFSLQRLMAVTQIAVSMVLVVGAILFVRSFRNLMTFDPGMRQAGVTVAFAGFGRSQVAPERYAEFRRDLLDEVRSIPGVLGAASTTNTPLLGSSWGHGFRMEGVEGSAQFTWVSPGYFQTMAIALRAGRDFERRDTAASARVALVNEMFARKYLAGSNPIGKTLRTNPEPNYPATVYEIVGVVADAKYRSIRSETRPEVFAPDTQHPNQGPWATIMIRSNAPTAAIAATLKRSIREKHPEIVTGFTDFQQRIRDGLARERLMAILCGFFGLLAVFLASVGLYGMISYIVAQRRNEIGVRMALGAGAGQVIAMVMRESAWLVAIGVPIGAGMALAAGRAAGSLLFGLEPYDPVTLAAACVAMAAIAGVASFVPARRALKLDPMMALRQE